MSDKRFLLFLSSNKKEFYNLKNILDLKYNMGDKQSKVKPTILTEDGINSLIETTSFCREEILQWHEGFIVMEYIIIFIIFIFK